MAKIDDSLEMALEKLRSIWPDIDDADQCEIAGVIQGMAIMAASKAQPA